MTLLRMEPKIRPPAGWQTRVEHRLAIHADIDPDSALAFARSVAAGLDDRPRWLDSRYLYDAAGSEIFERITEQPEYYQTRTEDALLARHASAIREIVGDVALVELGSGASMKTRRLLDAWSAGGPARYVPIDVCLEAMTRACRELRGLYPALAVEGLAADYERALPLLGELSPMALAFLGSSLGNLGKHEQGEFLSLVAGSLRPRDFLLLGLDFAKSPAVLEPAYDDAAGWTAAFTRNLFARMNRELGTGIPLEAVEHVARYDTARERIEIYARFTREVELELPLLARRFRIARGERIRTEVSYKYRPEAAVPAIERHGLRLEWSGADADRGFGLFLFQRLHIVAQHQETVLAAIAQRENGAL